MVFPNRPMGPIGPPPMTAGGPVPIAPGVVPGFPGNVPPPMPTPMGPQMSGPPPGGAPPGMPPGMAEMMGGAPPEEKPPLDLGPDPIQMLMQLYQQMIEEQAEKERKPRYPNFYHKSDYGKPVLSLVIEKVKEDHSRHGLLMKRIAEDLDTISGQRVGTFKNYDKQTESTFHDTALSAEFQLMKTMLGTIDIYFEADARRDDDKDEAAAKESALYFWRKEFEKSHAEQGNGDLNMDIADSFLSAGRAVWRGVINNEAESTDSAFCEHLLDPATCYPTWEGHHGLRQMTRYYSMKVAEVVGTFDMGDDKVRNKVLGTDKSRPIRKLTDSVDVMEYWDRRWYAIVVDGEYVHGPVEHGYGLVPFVYQIVPLGRPSFTRSPYSIESVRSASIGSENYSSDEELAEQGVSYVHYLKWTHHQREALLGRLFTGAGDAINPAIIIEQDDFARAQGAPKVSAAGGARNVIMKDRESIGPFPTTPNPGLVQPLMAMMQDAYSRWTLPSEAHGMTSNTQQSGSAVESLSDAGREKMAPYLKAMTMFEKRIAETRLYLFRNFGWHLGSEGERGTFYIPRSNPRRNQDRYMELTHGMLRRTDTKVNVRLTSLKLQNMGPLANALSIMKNNGWMTDERALRYFDVRDPQSELRQIRIQKAKDEDPDYQQALLEQALEEEGDTWMLAKVRQKKNLARMDAQTAAMQGGPPAPGGPGGMPPPSTPTDMSPPQPPPVQIQGASLPGMGMPPGVQGGRPPGVPGGGII